MEEPTYNIVRPNEHNCSDKMDEYTDFVVKFNIKVVDTSSSTLRLKDDQVVKRTH